jgi:hypothetical protein
MAKILCVLHPDPVGGYPKSYARDGMVPNGNLKLLTSSRESSTLTPKLWTPVGTLAGPTLGLRRRA